MSYRRATEQGDRTMKRRTTAGRRLLITMMLGGSLVAAACSGAPPAATGTVTPLTSSSAPAEETTVPTGSPAVGSPLPSDAPAVSAGAIDPSEDVCAPYAAGARPPATAEEKALLDRMPETVDGEPVRDPQAYQAMQVFCSGADDGGELVQVFVEEFGLDLRTIVMGRFGATVDSYTVVVEVIRAPGQDANAMLTGFAAIGVAFDPGSGTPASVGGKDVTYREFGGEKRYEYVDGDTIWHFTVLTEAQATALITALG